MNWIPKHLAVAPFGTFFFAMLLWSQGDQRDLPTVAHYSGLGAVFHGMAASMLEAFGNMFRAWEKRKEELDGFRQQGAARRIAMLQAVATPQELEVLHRLLERADMDKSK